MQCRELVELVTRYLDGDLSPEEHARFEAHLAECEGCVRYLHQMRSTVSLLHQLADERVPVAMRDHLLAAFRDWNRGSADEPPT